MAKKSLALCVIMICVLGLTVCRWARPENRVNAALAHMQERYGETFVFSSHWGTYD